MTSRQLRGGLSLCPTRKGSMFEAVIATTGGTKEVEEMAASLSELAKALKAEGPDL